MKKLTVYLAALLLVMMVAPVCHAEAGTAPGNILIRDIVTFGRYEQDNNPDNGPEDIEWIAMEEQDGKVLLVSRCGLDMKTYHTAFEDVTWETCSLRAWLNSEFLNTAFTETEQAAIELTEVDNSDEQGISLWNTTGGNNTWDRIFLLSDAEGKQLYKLGDEYVCCELTQYATIKGSTEINGTLYLLPGSANWWLRSPGEEQRDAEYSSCDGWVRDWYGVMQELAVRPALWLDQGKVTIVGSRISAAADDASGTQNDPDWTEEAGTAFINKLYALAKKNDKWYPETYYSGKGVVAIYDSDVSEEPYIILSGTESEYTFPEELLADSVENAEYAILIYPVYVQAGNNNGLFDTYATLTYVCIIDTHTGKVFEKTWISMEKPPEEVSQPEEAYGAMRIQEALDYAAGPLGN